MFDTIEILSPILPLYLVNDVKNMSSMLQKIDLETGEIKFQVTTGELLGSYDSRLSIRIVNGNRIKLSGSIHKFILGHNIFGGPKDIKQCCNYIVALAEKRLNIELPSWVQWELMRADITHVFNLGSQKNIETYLSQMSSCTYNRRKLRTYGNETVYFPGVSTTWKAYNKGVEFVNHDRVKLIKSLELNNPYNLTVNDIDLLGNMSKCLLRLEIEVRKRKLKYDNVCNLCGVLNNEYFERVYENEVLKVIKEGGSGMIIVKDLGEVKNRLSSVFEKRKANNLFNVWTRIQMEGEARVKKDVHTRTWSRYKKDFARAGVSLAGSCTVSWNTELPKVQSRLYDFVPLPGNRNHVSGIFLDVEESIRLLKVS